MIGAIRLLILMMKLIGRCDMKELVLEEMQSKVNKFCNDMFDCICCPMDNLDDGNEVLSGSNYKLIEKYYELVIECEKEQDELRNNRNVN